jgi:hypothetical protein
LGQRLPFLLEARQQAVRIQAGADDLERHAALYRLGLIAYEDNAHTPFAQLLAQLVTAGEDLARLDSRPTGRHRLRLGRG